QRQLDGLLRVVLLEELRRLADLADEDEAAHARVEVLQRVDELQHEARHVAHRIGDVAQDHDLRFVADAAIELDAERDAAVLQVLAQRVADVELAALAALAADRHDILEPLRQLGDSLAHAAQLVLGQIVEALFGQAGEAIALALRLIALLELEAHGAADHLAQVAQALIDELLELLEQLRRQVGVPDQPLESLEPLRQSPEPEGLRRAVAETALLVRTLDRLR